MFRLAIIVSVLLLSFALALGGGKEAVINESVIATPRTFLVQLNRLIREVRYLSERQVQFADSNLSQRGLGFTDGLGAATISLETKYQTDTSYSISCLPLVSSTMYAVALTDVSDSSFTIVMTDMAGGVVSSRYFLWSTIGLKKKE